MNEEVRPGQVAGHPPEKKKEYKGTASVKQAKLFFFSKRSQAWRLSM